MLLYSAFREIISPSHKIHTKKSLRARKALRVKGYVGWIIAKERRLADDGKRWERRNGVDSSADRAKWNLRPKASPVSAQGGRFQIRAVA